MKIVEKLFWLNQRKSLSALQIMPLEKSNLSNKLLILLALGVFAVGLILFFQTFDHEQPTIVRETQLNTAPVEEEANVTYLDLEPVEIEQLLPGNAIVGERVIHFSSREAYLEYLERLSDLGLSPLSKVDSLLAIRVSTDALSRLNPVVYGGEAQLSYRIEAPLPPVEFNPELLVRLSAFGVSAKSIVGELGEGNGAGVLVAVLDSGIEDHSYFDDTSIHSMDLTDRGVSGAGAGHGTAVASIIAGQEGVAPAADLLVIRVLDDQGVGSSFDVADGIVRAVDSGAQIINLSLGVYQDTQILREAIQYAHSQGVLLVAAAGNDGYDQLPYPAAYSQVLAVTAIDANDQHAVFPNQSKAIDLAAPGVGILAAAEDNSRSSFSGTSAAAPFVTGTLAALLSVDSTLDMQTATNLLGRYLDEAGAVGVDSLYGAGLLNWDRLRERDTSTIDDVALASIYLPMDAQPGTTMPIEVTVQNQGTTWITAGKLEVIVGDAAPKGFTVGTLAPGQTTTRSVYTQIPSLYSEEVILIGARVLSENVESDVRPENNVKTVFFKPVRREN